jgi:hypothetical protein
LWAYTWGNHSQHTIKIPEHSCLSLRYSQYPSYGNSVGAHQWMKTWYILWLILGVLVIKEKWSLVIFRIMDGTRDHVKWNKSDAERQISLVFCHIETRFKKIRNLVTLCSMATVRTISIFMCLGNYLIKIFLIKIHLILCSVRLRTVSFSVLLHCHASHCAVHIFHNK